MSTVTLTPSTDFSIAPLFEPINLGAIALPNRIIMAPLTRARSGESRIPNGLMLEHYVQRASAGRRTITLSIPTRYIHTVTESVHQGDLKSAVSLLAAWLSQ